MTTYRVREIPPIEHAEAMRLAATEYDRLLALVDSLTGEMWARPTDCPGWDVTAILGHTLGMWERNADEEEAARQNKAAAAALERRGGLWLDALTDLQVREHAQLTPAELVEALHREAPRSLAGRDLPSDRRAVTMSPGLPGEGSWTLCYLMEIIHTRDPWMHRIDICRAVGREPALTPDHDGRLIADVVAEWARRHGQPFDLVLDGDAGGHFRAGEGGWSMHLDAVEFARILSGRGTGADLLGTPVPF